MNKFRFAVIFIALAAGSLLTSFGLGDLTYKQPTIKFVRYDVKSVGISDAKVDFVYSVENPNAIGLNDILADYALYLGHKTDPTPTEPPTATGKDVKFSIGARTTSPFVLPMTVNYLGFFHSSEDLSKAVLSGQKTIPFVLKTIFHLSLGPLKFSVPITTTGDLPLPKPQDLAPSLSNIAKPSLPNLHM